MIHLLQLLRKFWDSWCAWSNERSWSRWFVTSWFFSTECRLIVTHSEPAPLLIEYQCICIFCVHIWITYYLMTPFQRFLDHVVHVCNKSGKINLYLMINSEFKNFLLLLLEGNGQIIWSEIKACAEWIMPNQNISSSPYYISYFGSISLLVRYWLMLWTISNHVYYYNR